MSKASHYSQEERDEFLARAIEFMQKKPDASRARVAKYSGVGMSVLERFEKEGKLTLPKPMTKKQVRNKYKWINTLGKLNG
jgi:hypothetical protein